ncbi:MAG: cysteine-rich CWC family protein [Bacteroidales bacterium]|nr:cysteine-rich CWC family protein [Bacteroidales bacterium]MDY0198035.1 cysteine-rich CWC family protein [Tenuifilaceae bacterium]
MGVIRFKQCPSCNDLFDCYCESDKECWCSEFKLSADRLKMLAKKYTGCLCPDCIEKFSKGDIGFKQTTHSN